MKNIAFLVVLAILAPCTLAGISRTCLDCICLVESGCNENIHCGDGGLSCGPYQIQYGYWTDAGSKGSGWRSCVGSFGCSEATVRAYMNRYATYRRLRRSPTCEDYARIHNGGPFGHLKSSTVGYWGSIQSKGGCSKYS